MQNWQARGLVPHHRSSVQVEAIVRLIRRTGAPQHAP
jgi:hypothetical protein